MQRNDNDADLNVESCTVSADKEELCNARVQQRNTLT